MNPCKLDTDYLNGHLSPERARLFEAHLSSCERCREKVTSWRTFERSLRKWAGNQVRRPPTVADAERLMERACPRPLFTIRPVTAVAWASGLAACAALAWLHVPADKTDVEARSSVPVPVVALVPDGELFKPIPFPAEKTDLCGASASEKIVADIGGDRVGVSPGGKVRVLEAVDGTVRLALLKGSVACQVTPRRDGGEFVVEVGDYRVKVIGTKFQVTRSEGNGVSVMVERGKVEVSSSSGVTWYLGPNDAFAVSSDGQVLPKRAEAHEIAFLNNLLSVQPSVEEVVSLSPPDISARLQLGPAPDVRESPDTAVEPPRSREKRKLKKMENEGDLALWREWVLNGRAAEARTAMERHLSQNPTDAETWALLADCRRKGGSWHSAISAYERVRTHGSLKESSHATFMMATIHQKHLGNHVRAIELFSDYKHSEGVSRESRDLTDVHIARSMIAVGRTLEAKTLLEAVVARQGSSFVAANAKKLLQKCCAE